MNCSIVQANRLFIGCRDRRIFVYDQNTLALQKIIEVAESVHCFCRLKNGKLLGVGMTDGNILLLETENDDVQVHMEGRFRDIGGIWSICGCNQDQDLALGTIGGLFFVQIMDKQLLRTDEIYLEDKNVWNVVEYDQNKLACTSWVLPHVYLVDRNDPLSAKKPIILKEPNSKNNHATDLIPLPNYSFSKNPYLLKRAMKQLSLIDVRNQQEYVLYEDQNAEWGYNKIQIRNLGNDAFELLYIANEGKSR